MKRNDLWLLLLLLGAAGVALYLVSRRGAEGAQLRAPTADIVNPMMTYQNEEEWEIRRDESGRIVGVIIHRDARAT